MAADFKRHATLPESGRTVEHNHHSPPMRRRQGHSSSLSSPPVSCFLHLSSSARKLFVVFPGFAVHALSRTTCLGQSLFVPHTTTSPASLHRGTHKQLCARRSSPSHYGTGGCCGGKDAVRLVPTPACAFAAFCRPALLSFSSDVPRLFVPQASLLLI